MIKSFKIKGSDEKLISDSRTTKLESEIRAKQDPFDYSKVIVKKPWGYEYLVFENEFVAIWMLHIVRKRKTSMHSHPKKRTSLILLAGNATCSHLEGSEKLNPMEGIVIEEGVFHMTEASNELPIDPQSENGIWVMEIESPPNKADLIRMKDEYGRSGKAYEGTENMVFDPSNCIKFQEPEPGKIIHERFNDCIFSLARASALDLTSLSQDALVSVIRQKGGEVSTNPYLKIGGLATFKDFCENTENENLDNYNVLTIEKTSVTMKVSDYIFSELAALGIKDVFTVSGGAAMHLLDSLGTNKDMNYISTHHEQAAAMAAEGNARITGKPGVALVTSGPGATNTLTGVCGAWIDSIPAIFISGQVTSNTLIEGTGLRQFGVQESDIVSMVKSVTKYAVTIKDPNQVKYHLQKAIYLATSGRPGPVWLDIPLDIQSKRITPDKCSLFKPEERKITGNDLLKKQVSNCVELLKKSERPVLISGYGIRLAKGEKEFLQLVQKLGIPVISSWTTSDLISSFHELYIGRSGNFGDRAGNFTVQNSDLLLSIGSRLSVPQVGYNFSLFARAAKKIIVDIDPAELKKPSLDPDLPIKADAKEFMLELLSQLKDLKPFEVSNWLQRCQGWKLNYPVVLPEYKECKDVVNSFYFIQVLSEKLDEKAVIITDMGTSFTCTMQTFKTKLGQRLSTSSGHASMGFGLPGAIGACVGNNRKDTICISGDGGLQMNIQELQTIVHYNLPIKLFVLNNNGYLTIKATQQNHFGRFVGAEESSGVTCPDIIKIATAYGLPSIRISNTEELNLKIDSVLEALGPMVCEIIMGENQPLIPRVSSLKKPDGTIISKPIEDLYPFLSREEFLENMIVDPTEILK
ncbi:thiamine pyrophosphate-binding protein [Nitrospinaceae bacterium]|nr:thiamine pyrophosphate-binding protein [Nitrospinaceae bacterium]